MTNIENILRIAALKNCAELVGGESGIKREVQYITVMEVPDFNISSLDENSLVLTTLFAHHASVKRINSIIERLCIQNVSGIIVKLGRYVHELSASTVGIANKFGVPLIAIRGNILFREIIKDASEEIMQEQRAVINGVNQLNEVLINIVLRNDKIYKILEALGDKINNCCYCLNLNGDIVSQYHCGHADKTACIDFKLYIDKLNLECEKNINAGTTPFVIGEELHVFPCSTQNQVLGFLIVVNKQALGEKEMLFAKQTTSFLSIKFLEKQLQIETEQRMVMSVVDDIIFGKYKEEAVIADRLKLLGFKPQKYHRILFLSAREEASNEKVPLRANAYEYWQGKILKIFPNAFIFLKGMDYVVILSFLEKSINVENEIFKERLEELLASDREGIDIGYSLPVDSLCSIPECYDQAQKALVYGRSVNPTERIFAYLNFFEIGLISHSVGSSDNKLVTERIIKPIKAYDSKRNVKLWETLEKSLMAKSLEDSAKALFIHISTLRYRLDKIREITNIDFFEPQGKFLLYLAYIVDKAGNKQGVIGYK